MRKGLILLVALVVLDAALLFVGRDADDGAAGSVRVGLVFDVGGRGDKSFNDAAFRGLERARDELGARIEVIEPGDGSDRESALRLFAAQGFDLVIGVGFIFTDDIDRVAVEYPNVPFVGIDYALRTGPDGQVVPPPRNVVAVKFREEEGAFLVGAVAALVSRTGAVGFLGGMDIPLIRRFEAGYRAGVAAVRPDCRVLVGYAGVTSNAFKDPAKGREIALAQYREGADVIFHASGSTGLGLFEAARETGGLAIGVDSDQADEAPGRVLTSMVKEVDATVFRLVAEVRDGRFAGGVRSFGLAEDGVDWVYDARNRDLVGDTARSRADALKADIVAGRIRVPTAP